MKIKLSKPLDLHTTGADFTQPLFLKYNLIGSYILASLYMGKSKSNNCKKIKKYQFIKPAPGELNATTFADTYTIIFIIIIILIFN